MSRVENIENWYRFLNDQPCLICGGIEGCDHTVMERACAVIEDATQSVNPKVSDS